MGVGQLTLSPHLHCGSVGKAWLTGPEATLWPLPQQDEREHSVAFYKTLFTKMLMVACIKFFYERVSL